VRKVHGGNAALALSFKESFISLHERHLLFLQGSDLRRGEPTYVVLGTLHSPAMDCEPGEFHVLGDATVAADARLSGGTTVGYGAVVESGAEVFGSVIFDGASIGSGAVIRDSIIGKGAVIHGGATLDGVVIGDQAHVGTGNELTKGLRLWPGTRLEPTSVRFSSDA